MATLMTEDEIEHVKTFADGILEGGDIARACLVNFPVLSKRVTVAIDAALFALMTKDDTNRLLRYEIEAERMGYERGVAEARTFWLIEWPADDHAPLRWFCGGKLHHSLDWQKAVRFSRKEDAEATMLVLHLFGGAIAVEHGFATQEPR